MPSGRQSSTRRPPTADDSAALCGLLHANSIMQAIGQFSFFWIFAGGLCYYLALPPVNFAPLALAVPICWGIAVLRPVVNWYAVYFTAYLFWLASIWWVACPYPPWTLIGLFVLSAVLALFWVLFFVSVRVAVLRYRIPLAVAMTVCWLGTEYLRCRFFGGFSFCAIEHAFYLYPRLIQWASVGGSMLVGGMIMFLGAVVVEWITSYQYRHSTQRRSLLNFASLKIAVIVILVAVVFPIKKTDMNDDNITSYSIVALQGNRQVYIDGGLPEAHTTFQMFLNLVRDEIYRRRENNIPMPDIIVFPETVCPIPLLVFEGDIRIDDLGFSDAERYQLEDGRWFRDFVHGAETPVLFGLSTWAYVDTATPIRLNSALFVQPQYVDEPDKMLRYDKMHLVLLGEYVPLAEYLPDDFFLRTLCHEARHGTMPLAIPIGQNDNIVEAAINICFESSVAHLIRQQILTLRNAGKYPRILINLSNDGWFRNSAAIEQHLATHIFRAVENRMYYITATNGGFSAIISPYGEIRNIGRRETAEAVSGTVSVNLNETQTLTLYQIIGDWYALPFAIAVLTLTAIGWRDNRRTRRKTAGAMPSETVFAPAKDYNKG